MNHHSARRVKLWSFEIKKKIDMTNIRECFFQTVSNSSWANFSYLVASEIETSKKDKVLEEFRILFGLQGIGLIELNVASPAESKILIQSNEKREPDFSVMNRLAKENSDFLKYITRIKEFYLIE